MRLDVGVDLGFRVLSAPGERHCLGYHLARGPESSDHIACPTQTTAERGYQCGLCFARDDLRFMHDFHRSGNAPEGLLHYLAQEHWLYVATFADGATKVGTASALRKWHRLAEQGAVAAQYVACATDGRIVRVLEDAVTRHAGLQQAVRAAAKTSALAAPLDSNTLDKINGGRARGVRQLLGPGINIDGFAVTDEQWKPPSSWAKVLGARAQLYPHPLETGEHGLLIEAMLGSCALAVVGGDRLLADLSRLKGKRLELGDFRSQPAAVQHALF
ncbi:DUF2797 domain-containing protein [Arthrobacter sp. H5]|uniref:DUF2797 domain-containing protein n=1 Tax=Arthrobacter sp. H5 TaxID=1267973 RepID=UPI0020A67AD3|nr:DUF2797 domain-containing protein [Arthrobacter sp. H5]